MILNDEMRLICLPQKLRVNPKQGCGLREHPVIFHKQWWPNTTKREKQ